MDCGVTKKDVQNADFFNTSVHCTMKPKVNFGLFRSKLDRSADFSL